MKRIVVAAAIVLAAPAAHADRYVEEWVGTWSGAASWKGCTAAGADEIEVQVLWRDGTLWIDGGQIYDGLGEVAPDVRDGDVLVFETDDLKVELRPATKAKKKRKKRPATLTFTTAAQCTMTAKLTRGSETGIAACDRLAALDAVARSCELDPGDPLEKHTAAACTTRADELRPRLVAGACMPPDEDPRDLPACREVWSLAQRIMRCTRAPAEYKRSTVEHVADLKRTVWKLEDAEASAQCDESALVLRETAEILRCP